ncbi:unnamed protein product [Brassicogethes aeneus]|uniref:DUF2428 domain-containing protein n=1 Tax=Brassicogethes aeneus TaxID=1431903 RepID=A0A9P0FAX4_BRAAE|nr:unnamed protein product [Brassicogethes aeneus]
MDKFQDFISFLAFLGEQDKIILNNNIEVNSRRISELLLETNNDTPKFYVELLTQIGENNFVILHDDKFEYKIFIHEKWMFTVTLLVSLRHNKYISNQKLLQENSQNDIRVIMMILLNNLKISEVVTLQLLILLEIILKKHSDVLEENLCVDTLKNMNNIALCPISKFKYYAHCISKIILKFIPKKCLNSYENLHYLPVRGIETSDLVKVVYQNQDFDINLVKKCIRLFQNNLDSKDGSSLYEFLISCDFEFWREKIWPYFKESFENIKLEGEYFQSLVKYWIPLNIKRYQDTFYDFLLTQNINFTLESLIYYELKKQSFNGTLYDENMLKYVKNNETKNIVLKTFVFKGFKPRLCDLNALKYYLFSTTDILSESSQKTLRQIFSHIFLYGNNLTRKNIDTEILEDFFVDLYNYICPLFNIHSDLASQLLLIILNSAKMPTKKLTLSYTPERLDFYEENNNLLYKKMKECQKWHFENQTIIDLIKFWFLKTEGVNENMTHIILGYFTDNIKIECDILKIVENFAKNPNLQSCEKIKNYAKLCENADFEKIMCVQNDLLNKGFIVCDENNLFKSVLLMEVILIYTEKNVFSPNIDYFLIKSVDVLNQLLNEKKFRNITNRATKILETYINNLLIFIKISYAKLPNNLKEKIMELIVKIIQISNMKKPVTMSVEVLKFLGCMENNFDKNLNIKLLARTMEQIIFSPERLNVKIRRNPETRLVMHALITSEKHSDKPLLFWCLEFLMDVLRNKKSSDSALTSSFHCLEIIVSDNTIQKHTMKYVPEIIEHTVLLYKNPSWSVRNGLIQMVKAIIERFFGVFINLETRPKTIEDLFVIFPKLSTFFQQFLNQPNFTPSHVIIFLYFSESKFRDQIFQNPEVVSTRFKFSTAFFDLANSVTGYYGNQMALLNDFRNVNKKLSSFRKNGGGSGTTSQCERFSGEKTEGESERFGARMGGIGGAAQQKIMASVDAEIDGFHQKARVQEGR